VKSLVGWDSNPEPTPQNGNSCNLSVASYKHVTTTPFFVATFVAATGQEGHSGQKHSPKLLSYTLSANQLTEAQ
jgi:hypothetical protein